MSERFTNMIEDSDLEGTLARMSVCPDQNTGIGPKTEPNVLAGVNLDEMMLRIWAENTGQRAVHPLDGKLLNDHFAPESLPTPKREIR